MHDTYSREVQLERSMPHSPDAERGTVGLIILDNELIGKALEMKLKDYDFYSPNYKRIYKAMLALYERGVVIEPVMIGEELKKEGSLESIGGVAFISQTATGIHFSADITRYIQVIKDKSVARQLIKTCSMITSETLAEEKESSELLDEAEAMIYGLRDEKQSSGFVSAGQLASTQFEQSKKNFESYRKGEEYNVGMSTGWTDIDFFLGGLQTSFILIGGRPSMGKTSYKSSMLLNVTDLYPDAVIADFSMEMTKEQLTNKMISQDAKVDLEAYVKGRIVPDQWKKVAEATEKMQTRKIFIDDTPGQSVLEIRAKCRRLKSENKRLDMIVVDHLGKVRGSGRYDSRSLELGETTNELFNMSREFKVPVILLVQLSRKVEERKPPIPMMSDLRESGRIEEDADIVQLLYREEYYNKTEANSGVADILTVKNRITGKTGRAKLAFLSEYARFENYFGD